MQELMNLIFVKRFSPYLWKIIVVMYAIIGCDHH